jgi:hypothetical protein
MHACMHLLRLLYGLPAMLVRGWFGHEDEGMKETEVYMHGNDKITIIVLREELEKIKVLIHTKKKHAHLRQEFKKTWML